MRAVRMETVADNQLSGFVAIFMTVVIAMVLAVLPLPEFVPAEVGFLRPDWIAMVLVYWMIAVPHRIGIFTAWTVGLVVDVLLGSLLGQHALAYVIIAYVSLNLYQRLRMFTVWQQALVLFALLGLNQLINFWVESIADDTGWSMWYLMPAVAGAFLWPWVFMLLRYLRRRLAVT